MRMLKVWCIFDSIYSKLPKNRFLRNIEEYLYFMLMTQNFVIVLLWNKLLICITKIWFTLKKKINLRYMVIFYIDISHEKQLFSILAYENFG